MTRRALVVGAGGAVGEAIASSLLRRGWRVTASMRRASATAASRLSSAGADVVSLDLSEAGSVETVIGACDAVFFATHLALTVQALARTDLQSRRILALSSNNVAIHADSPSYRQLAEAEKLLRVQAPNAIVVRPTMIFGDPRLSTLTRLLRMAHRLTLLPMPGSGRARVQPVFHEDLGELVAGLPDFDSSGGIYAVGGPDIVPMRELFEMAVATVGGRATIVPISGPFLTAVGQLRLAGFTPEQAERSERDRVAIPQSALPPSLTPTTTLQLGLAKLWSAMTRNTG